MPLTVNQRKAYQQLKSLFTKYKLILLRAACCAGKDYVAQKFLLEQTQQGVTVVEFDLCQLCRNLKHQLTSQDIASYLESLSDTKGHQHLIYIRRIDSVQEVLSEYGMPLRHLFPLILTRWAQKLPANVKVLMTANHLFSLRIENTTSWNLQMVLTAEDGSELLQSELERMQIEVTPEYQQRMIKINKIPVPGHLIEGLQYAKCMIGDVNEFNLDQEAFFNYYREGYLTASGLPLETQKEIPKPVPAEDLIGLESILEQIRIAILHPIELNHPEVSIAKGAVLCGPRGTSKSSVGRWLAHQLGGKLYLIGGETSAQNSNFISIFEDTVKEAAKNSPAVVFIDDVDTLFSNDGVYRAFLTILDGLDSEKRSNVCIIVTCMSLATIPASLLRGGRLELCIFTRLPTLDLIQQSLEVEFQKIQRVAKLNLEDERAKLIQDISLKMLGFNYADIRRCTNDVLRSILATRNTDLVSLFETCINQIKQQYQHCKTIEETDISKTAYLEMYN
jgi:predicted AAA+ superfamily ATPase